MADNLNDISYCPVCMESYKENGENIPRILPCFHTLCEKCIRQLLKEEALECPECRVKHRAENEFKSFPQNKYILAHIGQQTGSYKCKNHGKALDFYCKYSKCQKPICSKCLLKEHRTHDVEDLQEATEEKCKDLRENVELFKSRLKQKQQLFQTYRKEMNEALKDSINKVGKKKEEIMQIHNTLIKEITDQKTTLNKKIGVEVSTINDTASLINGMFETTKKSNITYEEIVNTMELFQTVVTEHDKRFTDMRNFSFLVYRDGKTCAEDFFGNFVEKEICMDTLATKSKPECTVQDVPASSTKSEKPHDVKCEGKIMLCN